MTCEHDASYGTAVRYVRGSRALIPTIVVISEEDEVLEFELSSIQGELNWN